MTDLTLTKTRLNAGVWEGVLAGATDAKPVLVLRHADEIVASVTLEDAGQGKWAVQIPVPSDRINDEIQTFVIVDESSDAILASFAIFAGEQLSDALQVEVDLLRAELDILKRAFRKHCIETA